MMFIIKLKTFNVLFVKMHFSHVIVNYNDILIMFIINHFNNVNYVKNNSNVIWKIILLNVHKIINYLKKTYLLFKFYKYEYLI